MTTKQSDRLARCLVLCARAHRRAVNRNDAATVRTLNHIQAELIQLVETQRAELKTLDLTKVRLPSLLSHQAT